MWIYTRPKTEHEPRFLLNLDESWRIAISQLGEKWLIEVTFGTESTPVATASSGEEAVSLVSRIFEALKNGEKALDLAA